MGYQLGATQWSLAGCNGYTLQLAKQMGLDCVQLEIGNWEKGLCMTQEPLQKLYVAESKALGIQLLPLALNTLCDHSMIDGFETSEGKIAKVTIEKGIMVAAKMGLEGVTIPNFGASFIETKAHYQHTVKALQYACKLAKAHGLHVYTENVLNATAQQVLFDDCGCDNLYLLFDSQNYQYFGFDYAVDVLKTHWDRVGSHIHIKDGGDMGTMILGTGTSPFAEVMAVIKERNYQGTLVVENNYPELPLRLENDDYFAIMAKDLEIIRAHM